MVGLLVNWEDSTVRNTRSPSGTWHRETVCREWGSDTLSCILYTDGIVNL